MRGLTFNRILDSCIQLFGGQVPEAWDCTVNLLPLQDALGPTLNRFCLLKVLPSLATIAMNPSGVTKSPPKKKVCVLRISVHFAIERHSSPIRLLQQLNSLSTLM